MNLEDRFREWFKGDADAVQFASLLWSATQEWDDVKDEGQAPSDALMFWLSFGMEVDPFYSRFAHLMRPCLMSSYLRWQASNVLDHEPDQVAKSYMLRAGIYDVWHMMAFIVGGHDWAVEIGPAIYREYGETVDELRKEMQCQHP